MSEERQVLAEGKFVRLVRRGHWEWAERTNTSGAVVVVAITTEGEIVFTEQYRIPLAARVIELPAGLVGDSPHMANEGLIDAARRELFEETGYEADSLSLVTEGPTTAGMTTEVVSLLVARNARRVGLGGGEASEDIAVHLVPLANAPAWLELQRQLGTLVDPKVYAGLFFAQ